ncbi:MAG: type II toxin-antitoxin system HipA family toxin, partial [Planctomycetales bacterium]|nr:type II toxin-antitoxin system HipA family toxin [Planctomycetales bacterium]
MPLATEVYMFPELARQSFYGLPGMLADSLPDKFGNLLINEWLDRIGRSRDDFSPVERLRYVGTRAVGALEYEPALRMDSEKSVAVDVAELVGLASAAVAHKERLQTRFTGEGTSDLGAVRDILRVGTSAGGARAKAVIAWNEATGEIRSGQAQAPPGFGYWLLKFDGVSGNRDKEVEDPQGHGLIEYAYYRMAVAAGIEMSESRILHENGRNHFVTRRFDRTDNGAKNFMQSLCALGHYDFNQAGAYSYEQAIGVAQQIGVTRHEQEQLFRRAVFNLLARNQDDHTKNIAFLMDKEAEWRLAPAFDMTYSYNPAGAWTSQHQMTLNGKRRGFVIEDFRSAADRFRLLRGKRLDNLLHEVDAAVANWPVFAQEAGVPTGQMEEIGRHHRRLDRMPRE